MIGEKILAAREAAGMTQEELGKAVGVSRDTIRRWEKEKTSPSIEQLMTIARVTANEPLLSLCQDLFEKAQSVKRDNTEKFPIPVISMRTPACAGNGNGIEAISLEADEWEDVDRSFFRTMDEFRKPFAVYVEGDSMEEMDIFEGERAVINPAEPPEDGECALVSYKGRWSIKGVQTNKDGSVSLLAGKPQYNRIIPSDEACDENWFKVIGRVVAVLPKIKKAKRFW